jgi:hypothetical protein
MRRAIVTWRLGYGSPPGTEDLERTRLLLEPIERVGSPADAGTLLRELGLSVHEFVEPAAAGDAGEIALRCLEKGHRLGRGWAVLWPATARNADGSVVADELRRVAAPEFLDGLRGILGDQAPGCQMRLQGLVFASFEVRVLAEERPPAPVPVQSVVPPARAAPVPELDAGIRSALLGVMSRYLAVRWSWSRDTAAAQLGSLGLEALELEGDEWQLRDPKGIAVEVRLEGPGLRTIAFILGEQCDPHQLEEGEFAALRDLYEARFHALANAAAELLGPPAFLGASGEAQFPIDQWAEFAALWPMPQVRIMVQCRHNDPELPMQLCLAFAPPV